MERKVFLNEAEEITHDRQEPKEEVRGTILPFVKNEDGVSFGWPQWMVDTYNAFTLPRDTLKGYQPTAEDTTNFALTVAGGGLGSSKVAKPAGDVGMFLGEKSYGADLNKLLVAKIMDKRSMDREEIWEKTGWWKKPDGKWAWEISDKDMKLHPEIESHIERSLSDEGLQFRGAKKDLIRHEALSKHTDVLSDGELSVAKHPERSPVEYSGSFWPDSTNINTEGKSKGLIDSVLVHELQHNVQQMEGWSGGSNLTTGGNILNNVRSYIPPQAKELSNLEERYRDLVSEKFNRTRSDQPPKGWGQVDSSGFESPDMSDEDLDSLITYLRNAISNLKESLKPYQKAVNDFKDKYGVDLNSNTTNQPWELYRRNEGEALANLTSLRRKLSDEERRELPPFKSFGKYDIEKGVSIPKADDLWVNENDPEIFFLERWKYHVEQFGKEK